MIVFIEMSTYCYYHIVYIAHYCDVMNQVVDTEGHQPSVLQLLTLFSMKTRILVSKNVTFP